MDITHIANILKEYELYCYQVAYYMLNEEKAATSAAKQALIELGRSLKFLNECKEAQLQIVKKTILKHSLQTASQLELVVK